MLEIYKDILITVIGSTLGGVIAWLIAWYQVKKSDKNSQILRSHEFAEQKSFRIQELKLEVTRKVTDGTGDFNINLFKMVKIAKEREESGEKNNTIDNIEIQNLYEQLQNQLGEIYYCFILFDRNSELSRFYQLKEDLTKLHKMCRNFNDEYNEDNIVNTMTNVFNLMNVIDFEVRKLSFEVIKFYKES